MVNAIQCISDLLYFRQPCISKVVGCRAKRTEIWASGVSTISKMAGHRAKRAKILTWRRVGHFWLLGVQGQSKVIQCISDFRKGIRSHLSYIAISVFIPAIFEIQDCWKLGMHRMISEWQTGNSQKYPWTWIHQLVATWLLGIKLCCSWQVTKHSTGVPGPLVCIPVIRLTMITKPTLPFIRVPCI